MKAIYILGMSHIMPVLRACSPAKDGHYGYFGNGHAPSFIDWPTLPGSLPAPLKVASIYVGHIAPFWGPVLAHRIRPGKYTLLGDVMSERMGG